MNNAASFAIFGAVTAGLARLLNGADIVDYSFIINNVDSIFLAFFIVSFRIKMHLDDYKYFKEFDADRNRLKYVGLLLAVITWIMMALSGFTIDHPHASSALLAVSFAISTIWIAVHLLEIASSRERRIAEKFIITLRNKWVIINSLYIITLLLYSAGASVMVALYGKSFVISQWVFIAIMIFIVIIDNLISDSFST